jgi:hypothetical protein
MSSAAEEGVAVELAEADVCCANCGATEIDDIKLEECNDCDLVKYCSDKCRKDHLEDHEEECKRRAEELHDRELFTQPDETHLGECPICFLPLPLDLRKSAFYSCCSNVICRGCVHNYYKSNGDYRCSFCREPVSTSDEETHKRMKKRVKANDPVALRQMGAELHRDEDYDGAFQYLTKAAEFGDVGAHYMLGNMYGEGVGVEEDEEKEVYHYEKAAMGGHPYARNNLGYYEKIKGRAERSVKHYIIAANLGNEGSMKALWGHYSQGNITKEELDATLRSHQAALDATKSEQRDVAEASGLF